MAETNAGAGDALVVARRGAVEAFIINDAPRNRMRSALAVAQMLGCIAGAETKSLAGSLADERRAVHVTMGTPDQRDGMMAFPEKREPVLQRRES